ncbi:MAG TPA: prolipoprotein diacylglyceryl transferase family protein [Acidimicrobiia bacterium]|jgi:prolipoprotein diacylglyceryltransferase
MEFTLLAAAAIGIAGVWLMLRWEAARGIAAGCARDLWDVALGAIGAGIVVGRVAAMVVAGVNPVLRPADLIIVRAGVATGWASIGALAVVTWTSRRPPWIVADGLAAASLAGLSGWHAGCVVRSACLGTTTDLPWGFAASPGGLPRHPVEVYAAVLLLAAALALALWKARGRPPLGVPAGLALASAGAVRLVTEPLRPSLGGGPVWWYVAAMAAGTAVAARRWRTIAARRSLPPL